MAETLYTLQNRRSVRSYKPDQVPDFELSQIVEAGKWAPTGMGTQNPIMVVVRDKETRDLLSKLNAAVMGADRDPFYGAPCVIVVFADPNRSTWVEDGSLVMGNLLNAAHDVGVDSCWIHRAREVFDSPEGKDLMEKWGVPQHYRGVGNCILGYRDCEYPEPKPRKEGRIIYN
jgi:nitroreductase